MNKGMKWSAALLAAGIIIGGSGLTGGTSVSAAVTGNHVVQQSLKQPAVVLKYKGKTLTQQGKVINGNTMIPVTVLRDALGLPLSYSPSTRTATIGTGSEKLTLENSEYGANTSLNGYYIYSNTSKYEVKNLDGRLYVPFKLLNDYLGYQGVYNPSLKSLEISKRVMNDISISTETLNKSNKNADIQIQYPQISGLSDETQQAINALFKQKAEAFATDSEKQSTMRDAAIGENKYDFSQTFIVTFNREGVLSVVVDQSSYVGGAHGGTVREGLTFSLHTGKQLGLDALLKAVPNYKHNLDKMLKERTKDSFAHVSSGLNAKPDFYVKEDGIAILYQQNEISAYAAGFPTYEFNFSELLPKGTDPFASFK